MKRFFNLWVLTTVALYYFGPVEWSGAREPWVAAVALSSLLAFNLGVSSVDPALTGPPRTLLRPPSRRASLVLMSVNAALTLGFLALSTGRSAFSRSAYTTDFGAAYDNYASISQQLALGPVGQVLLIAKALIFPFVLIALVHRFSRDPLLVGLFVGPLLISSLFRGTDKEVADVLVVVGVCAWVHGLLNWRRVLAGLAVTGAAAYVFLLRRVSRYGGDLPACTPTGTCFEYDSWTATTLGPGAEQLKVFATSYVTNGYQGLSLAVDLPWNPNWGIGHLPIVKTGLCSFVGQACSLPDYGTSLTASGWDARARWTSVYPVLANDLSFWLVPVFFVVLGVAFQRSLNAWRHDRDPAAGATLVVVAMFFVYSSANMQLAITLDWAFATIVLLYVSPWRARVRAPHAESAGRVPT